MVLGSRVKAIIMTHCLTCQQHKQVQTFAILEVELDNFDSMLITTNCRAGVKLNSALAGCVLEVLTYSIYQL